MGPRKWCQASTWMPRLGRSASATISKAVTASFIGMKGMGSKCTSTPMSAALSATLAASAAAASTTASWVSGAVVPGVDVPSAAASGFFCNIKFTDLAPRASAHRSTSSSVAP